MPAELVEHDPVVARDPDRMCGVSEVGEGVRRLQDSDSAREPEAVSIDRRAHAAVIGRGRERRRPEVRRQREPEALDQPEEAVGVVVGVDRGEAVGPRVVVEVRACRLRRRHDRRRLDVREDDDVPAQRLNVVDRCDQALERDADALGVERGRRCARSWARRGGRDRVAHEDEAADAVDERANVQHRPCLHVDDRPPVQDRELRGAELEVHNRRDVVLALDDRGRHVRQRDPRMIVLDRLVLDRRLSLRGLVAVDDQLDVADLECAAVVEVGALLQAEDLRESLLVDLLVEPVEVTELLLEVGLALRRRHVGVPGGVGADHAERSFLDVHGHARLPDGQPEHGLVVRHRRGVELRLLAL